MNQKWLNRIIFWLLCIIPWVCLVLLTKFQMIGPAWFVVGLLLYLLYYAPFVHINRLMQLKVIEEKDAWKLFIPFYHGRYLKSLWLG
jgi:hypothetical protein